MSERLGDLMRWLRESLQRDEELCETLRAMNSTIVPPDEKKIAIPQNKSFEELMRALTDCMESSIETIDRLSGIVEGQETGTSAKNKSDVGIS